MKQGKRKEGKKGKRRGKRRKKQIRGRNMTKSYTKCVETEIFPPKSVQYPEKISF